MMTVGFSVAAILLLVGLISAVVLAIAVLLMSRGKGGAGVVVAMCVLGLLVLIGIGIFLTLGLSYRRVAVVQQQALESQIMETQRAEMEARRRAEAESRQMMMNSAREASSEASAVPAEDAASESRSDSTEERLGTHLDTPDAPAVAGPPASADPPSNDKEADTETNSSDAEEAVEVDESDERASAEAVDAESDPSSSSADEEPESGEDEEAESDEDDEVEGGGDAVDESVEETTSPDETVPSKDQEARFDPAEEDGQTAESIHGEAETTEGTFATLEEIPAEVTSDGTLTVQDVVLVHPSTSPDVEEGQDLTTSSGMADSARAMLPEGIYIPTPSKVGESKNIREAAERPLWVVNPPATIDGHYATVLVSDPFETRFLCDEDLQRRARKAIVKYAQSFAHARGHASMSGSIPITDDDIQEITQDRFYVLRPTSLGEMTVGYQLIVFNESVHAKLEHRVQEAVVDQRIAWAGVLSGGVLAVLTSVFGMTHLLARKAPDPFAS